MDIVPVHLRKMPLKYWGMVPSLSGPLRHQNGGHHGQWGYQRNGGKKLYVGNQYILHRNSMGGGNNLFIFYSIEDEDKWPPPCALRRLYPCAAPRRCPFVVVVRRSSSPPSPPSLSPMLCLIVVCNFFPSLSLWSMVCHRCRRLSVATTAILLPLMCTV